MDNQPQNMTREERQHLLDSWDIAYMAKFRQVARAIPELDYERAVERYQQARSRVRLELRL